MYARRNEQGKIISVTKYKGQDHEEKIDVRSREYADFVTPPETYADRRKKAYPSVQEQLDYIYHNTLTKWKTDVIKPIKDKYPKPMEN